MNFSVSLKLLVLLAVIAVNTAAPLKNHLVQFYPISQEQYDSILRMTAGRPVVSEGRLINSGFRTLNELRSSISTDISSGWRQLLNITGFIPVGAKSSSEKIDGYPLCVIKTNEVDDEDDEDDESEVDTTLSQGRAENEEHNVDMDNKHPIVSCIVVVKSKDAEKPAEYAPQQQRAQAIRRVPLYYPPYPYPYPYNVHPAYYPFYNYPNFAEVRQNTVSSRLNRPVAKVNSMRRQAYSMQRSNGKGIRAETSRNINTARSGYGYNPYAYGNYYQQGYPYGSYGGCPGSYGSYGRDEDDGDDESGEERDNSGEAAEDHGDDDE